MGSKSAAQRFSSALYHTSFYLWLILIAALLLASFVGLAEQSWRVGGDRRWNLVIVVAAYVALAVVSILHVWSRLLSIKKILRTMPKPYVPIKHVDVPKKVADHIQIEYSRTAVIAHISQATTGEQEGWGRPGTQWDTIHFRSYILDTIPVMRPPHNLHTLLLAAAAIDPGPLKLFVNSYIAMVERARYARHEPTEAEAQAVERVVELIARLVELKKKEQAVETDSGPETGSALDAPIEDDSSMDSMDRWPRGAESAFALSTDRVVPPDSSSDETGTGRWRLSLDSRE